jgi:predicted Zn-dependent protease with MMP-like domain
MSMKQFRRIVARVMETLPEEFRPHLDNIVVDVEEEPDEKTLRMAGFTDEEIAEGETLYGLFAPIDLPTPFGSDAVDVNAQPRRILIFKRPLEEDFPDRRELLSQIRRTVIHELAHHFGYTDHDLEPHDNPPPPLERLEAVHRARTFWIGLACLVVGVLTGMGLTALGTAGPRSHLPGRQLEATVYLPLVDEDGKKFSEERFDAALALFVKPFGGATLLERREGLWHDEAHRRLVREPIRPVVVSFEASRLEEFRQAARQAGRLLDQQAIYIRFAEPGIDLLAVSPERDNKPGTHP